MLLSQRWICEDNNIASLIIEQKRYGSYSWDNIPWGRFINISFFLNECKTSKLWWVDHRVYKWEAGAYSGNDKYGTLSADE